MQVAYLHLFGLACQHVHWDVTHTFPTRAYIARHCRCEHKNRQRCEQKKKRSQCLCKGYDEHQDVFQCDLTHISSTMTTNVCRRWRVCLHSGQKKSMRPSLIDKSCNGKNNKLPREDLIIARGQAPPCAPERDSPGSGMSSSACIRSPSKGGVASACRHTSSSRLCQRYNSVDRNTSKDACRAWKWSQRRVHDRVTYLSKI